MSVVVDMARGAVDHGPMLPRTRVKICCITSQMEAFLAVSAGACAVGLVAEMPSGPGVITDDQIRRIVAWVPPGVSTFLLTSRRRVPEIVAHVRATNATTVQLVDTLTEGTYLELHEALPGVKVVQVVHVVGPESVDEAVSVAREVNALLLDSGNPALAVKELGGTGRPHDWNVSRKIRDSVKVPVFLAGGLRPDNVAEAIATVKPYGVDVCSGVRTDGQLDMDKLARFMEAVTPPR